MIAIDAGRPRSGGRRDAAREGVLTVEGRKRGVGPRGAVRLVLPALVLATLAGLQANASGREIAGSVLFSEEVVVPRGETWKVMPGASVAFRGGRWTVRGRLLVEGTPSRPVRITGDNAYGGLDFRGETGSRVSGAILAGGTRGAAVTNTSVAFRDVRWENQAVALDVGQYARADVRDCAFVAPARAGILVKRGGAADIAGCRFEKSGLAGVYVYGARDVTVADCRFAGNKTGVIAAMAGARVRVSGGVFEGNGTALFAERLAAPEVGGCEVTGNGIGFLFSRRADGTVSGCTIAGNGDGVVVEYSSYPVFHGNAFRGNRGYDVRLRHQSSQWEGEAGEADREVAGGALFGAAPGGRRDFRPADADGKPGPPRTRAKLTGTVDFRENTWEGRPARGDQAGKPGKVHDGNDEPEFEYRGKRYRMDRVLFR